MLKKITALIFCLSLLVSAIFLSVSAADIDTPIEDAPIEDTTAPPYIPDDDEEVTEREDDTVTPVEPSWGDDPDDETADDDSESFLDRLQDVIAGIGDIYKIIFDWDQMGDNIWDWMVDADLSLKKFFSQLEMLTIKNGGYDYVSDDFNKQISTAFSVFYPLSVAIMLVSWCFGIAKDGLSSMFDLADKHSIVRSCLSIIIGLSILSFTGQFLSVLASTSWSYCNILYDKMVMAPVAGASADGFAFFLFFTIITYILRLNIVHIGVLQCIAPVFIGFAGAESTRKLTFNFLKSYAKCLMIPIVTIVYSVLTTYLMWENGSGFIGDFISALVFGISCIGVQKKILSELFQ